MWDDESRTGAIQRIGLKLKAIQSVSFEAGAVTAYGEVIRHLDANPEGDAPFLQKYYQRLQRSLDICPTPFLSGALYAVRDAAAEVDVALEPVVAPKDG